MPRGRLRRVVPAGLAMLLLLAQQAPQLASATDEAFTDITRRLGIDFRLENSRTSQKYLPETMCGGVATSQKARVMAAVIESCPQPAHRVDIVPS